MFPDRETVRVRTRRGFELEGSVNHRVLLPDDSWRRLDTLTVGQQVKVGAGLNVWATQVVGLDWQLVDSRITLQNVAEASGVSIDTVLRHREGKRVRAAERVGAALLSYDEQLATRSFMVSNRAPIRVPSVVDEDLAAFLGYLTGDGHISAVKRVIGLTTGDEAQADHFARLVETLFDITPRKKWDETKWRILFSSGHVQDFLTHLGLKTGVCAREKTIPDVILRSPKSVVAAFLRAYFDCDGYAGKQGVILSTASEEMGKLVQLLLLNFGILTRRRAQPKGCWHVHIPGCACCKVFQDVIGFGLARKQTALQKFLDDRCWAKKEEWTDEIVAIERRRADVYDISVEATHRYAAQGFINHNSYWHSTIMTQKALTPSEVIDFADHHSGTMAMQRGRLNPYKLGIELFRDIEERWNTGRFGKEFDECQDLEERRRWDRKLGQGRQKIFEVRRVHNDLTFIDTFLTPEFCVRHNLFSFAYQEQAGQYYIESRDFEKIKQRLLFSLTNFGKPWIVVVDGNYRNRGELLLKHVHNGVDMRLDHAADVLANLHAIWSRPVSLQTVVEDKPTLLSFDGTDHSIKTGGENDDPRRPAPTKSR